MSSVGAINSYFNYLLIKHVGFKMSNYKIFNSILKMTLKSTKTKPEFLVLDWALNWI